MGEAFTDSIKPTMDSVSSGTASLSIPISSAPLAMAPPPRTTLTSLPLELLIPIAKHCDQATALSLALVCRSLAAAAEHGIWQRLDLCIQTHSGRDRRGLSSGAPLGRERSEYWRGDSCHQSSSDEDYRSAAALVERLRKMKVQGSETAEEGSGRKFDLVKAVRVTNKAAASADILRLLGDVSDKLVELELVGSDPSSWDPLNEFVHATGKLEHTILTSALSFPFLTLLRLGPLSIQNNKLLQHICAIAPCLRSIELESQVYIALNEAYTQTLPAARAAQCMAEAIRTMRFTFRARDVSFIVSNVAELEAIERQNISSVFAVLRQCPGIRQVSLDVRGDCPPALRKGLISVFGKRDESWDLHMSIDLSRFCALGPVLEALYSLRRLVIEIHHWYDLILHIPAFIGLETILLIPPLHLMVDPSYLQPPPSVSRESHTMPPLLADQLHNCPRLHEVYTLCRNDSGDYFAELDHLEGAGGESTLRVSSLHHGGAELLQARFLMRYPGFEVPSSLGRSSPAWRPRRVYDDDIYCGTWFDTAGQPAWVTFTEFEGLTVPLEVIEEMRAVAGVKEAEWKGRGVEVGDKAWKVLTDWRDGVLAG